jgi:hypothetical protein
MEDLQLAVRTLMRAQDVELLELWVMYWGYGGNLDVLSFDAFIHGLIPGDRHDLDVLRWMLDDLPSAANRRLPPGYKASPGSRI